MIKLNKNQRKFFVEAVEHFGERSYSIKFKELKKFAEDNDLILPVSALKDYCKAEKRGWYNIVTAGIEPAEEVEKEIIEDSQEPEEFEKKENIIIDVPVFVDKPKNRKKMKVKFDTAGKKPIYMLDPVYVVLDYNDDPISIHEKPGTAFQSGTKRLLHDNSNREEIDVVLELQYTGTAYIDSINSGLYFKIVMFPLKK